MKVLIVGLLLAMCSGCAHFLDTGALEVDVLNIVKVTGSLGKYKYATTEEDSEAMATNPVTADTEDTETADDTTAAAE